MTDAPRRRRPGVRTRILATVLVLTALGMAVAGVTTVLLRRGQLEDAVDASLRTEVTEFREIAADGVDPRTGERFTGVADLLRGALQKQTPDRDETFLTLVDGRPDLVPSGDRPVRLENEPDLVATIARLPPDAPVVLREARTSAGPVRYAAVQVTAAGRPEVGTYVVAVALERGREDVASIAGRYAAVAVVTLAVVGLAGWVVAGRLLRPLRLLRSTAAHISLTDLSERIPAEGSDDVSDLARTFNTMLDRLQGSFEAQQQFLDDAGHELRTPVTVIRGHLEVLDAADAAEVAEVRELLLDETDRMGRLVEELMVLAKARRPDFLRPRPVDLARLVADVADKARGLGDRRWLVDAVPEPPVEVTADPQRLTQALLQLADNAVKHTAAGDVVAFGAAAGDDGVTLWVRDTGPGVDPRDAGRIFERFGRTEHGPRVEGSGLGLAIVTAIAQAHGGTADVTAAPAGTGATFRIRLPAGAGVAR